jgi:Primase C terminal 2 (PriCT-2)/D5 N terminal like
MYHSSCGEMTTAVNYLDFFEDFDESLKLDAIIQQKTSSVARNLEKYISPLVTEKGSPTTTISNVMGRKNYAVEDKLADKFFVAYEACRLAGLSLHYTERQYRDTLPRSGVMIDLDRDQATVTPQITADHVAEMNRALCKVLVKTVDFGRRAEFHIFWIRKPCVALNDHASEGQPPYRDGLHALIPDLWLEKPLKALIIEKFREYMDDIFEDVENAQPPREMVDAACGRNPVYFLGSCKPGRAPYALVAATRVRVFREDVERENLRLEEVLARPNLTHELSLAFRLESVGGLPVWLQKKDYSPNSETVNEISRQKTAAPASRVEDEDLTQSINYLTNNNPSAREVYNLLDILPAEYASDYSLWLKVVFAVANCGPQYRPLAVWFSQKCSDKWNAARFEVVWNSGLASRGKAGVITLGSLRYWAKTAAPERFEELQKNNHNVILSKNVFKFEGRIEHAVVSRMLKVMLHDIFVTDIDDSLTGGRGMAQYHWFEFIMALEDQQEPGQLYKWSHRAKPEGLIRYTADSLPDVYEDVIGAVRQRLEAAEDKNTSAYFGGILKTLKLYQSKLTNDGFIRGVCSQAEMRFRNHGFMTTLDKDPNIIGVGNGVLELYPQLVLHKGFHEFRVSKYTNTVWTPFDPEEIYTKRIFKILRDIYIEPDMLEFILFHHSTGLDAEEAAGLLLLIVGAGSNGKSFTAKFAEAAIGTKYAELGKSGLLTDPTENSAAANEAQMHIAGKRYVYFDEFNREEQLNIKRIKAFCNDGKQTGRKNYGSQESYVNICNPVAISNYDFKILCKDNGTWRRIRYYRAKVTFTKNPRADNPYEKLIDRSISRKHVHDPEYKRAFLSILAHYRWRLYAEYDNDLTNVPCPTLDKETSAFQQRQDNIHRFIIEMVIVTEDDSQVSLDELAQKYIAWYRTLFGRVDIGLDVVKSELENSCLSADFINEEDVRILRKRRVRESTAENLRAGERRIKVVVKAK